MGCEDGSCELDEMDLTPAQYAARLTELRSVELYTEQWMQRERKLVAERHARALMIGLGCYRPTTGDLFAAHCARLIFAHITTPSLLKTYAAGERERHPLIFK